MPEVTLTGQIRSRSSSQGSDAQRNAIKVPVPPPDSAAVGEPDRVTISSEEQNGVKNMSKKRRPHPAQLKKSVLLSLANGTENDGGTKSPRHGSMLRRFSRAASFKKAREHLPVNIDLNGILHRFERHSTIHGICHASLAPNKRWRRFWFTREGRELSRPSLVSIFALCLIILIIQVIYTATKFLKYPKTVDLDMDALENVLQETGQSEGVAAAISTDNVKKARRELKRHQLNRRENEEEEKQQNIIGIIIFFFCKAQTTRGRSTFVWSVLMTMGLRVLVYANVSEYLPITEAVGFRITVHDKLPSKLHTT
ncbi:hypothetical protein niasHT_033653 [Heterodera trifolii]|uniref:Uncharacterized protein n=1 Tax=Heterodera trifolii TaxID=157864 RepID=A0ABD2I641_9BILA